MKITNKLNKHYYDELLKFIDLIVNDKINRIYLKFYLDNLVFGYETELNQLKFGLDPFGLENNK